MEGADKLRALLQNGLLKQEIMGSTAVKVVAIFAALTVMTHKGVSGKGQTSWSSR